SIPLNWCSICSNFVLISLYSDIIMNFHSMAGIQSTSQSHQRQQSDYWENEVYCAAAEICLLPGISMKMKKRVLQIVHSVHPEWPVDPRALLRRAPTEFTIAGAADTFDEAKVILNRVRLAYQKSMACSSQSSTSTIPMPRPPRRRSVY
ncbi:hypothetical protein MN116_000534, partial [Schistosoma mekongi]